MSVVTCKPFDQMSLMELRAEHRAWAKATAPDGWAYRYDKGHDTRDALAAWIEVREQEARERAA